MMTTYEKLSDLGYNDVIVFRDYDYESALVGISDDNRAIYDFDEMIEWLVKNEDFTYDDAVEWIEYNTLRALPYAGSKGPIVMYSLDSH